MSVVKRIVGGTAQQRIMFGNLVFAVLGLVAGLVFGLDRYDWATWAYLGVIVFGMLIGSRAGVRQRYLNGPEDLDRPGGPYDKLHGRS